MGERMAASPNRQRGRSPVVLLVEDDDAVREVLAAAFEDAGMTVAQARTRAESLRIAARGRPDAVVLDRHLPDGDGWEIVDELRRQAGSSDLVVIAMTAHVALTSAERALGAGCDAFIEKPCEPAVVVDHAKRLLDARAPNTTVRRRRLRDS